VGLIWNFMVLHGQQYCISRNYDSSNEDIYDIFRLMKGLKTIIQTKLL
jgi:endonuclease III